MNCRRVEELIPLYAGGDLDMKTAGEVQSHLKSCSGCAELAGEYEASRTWLSGATPDLDEALLADMKRGVMRELQTAKPRPGLLELMSAAIARTMLRPAVAAALLLVIVGALTLWLYLGSRASRGPTQAVVPVPQFAPEQAPSVPDSSPPKVFKKDRRTGDDQPRRVHLAGSQRGKPSVSGNQQTQASNTIPNSQPPSAMAIDSGGMLRIEIQTADPSIRIIWFAPKEIDSQQSNP
jgi:hypothetical protein